MRHKKSHPILGSGLELVLHTDSDFQHLSRLSARSVDDLELHCLCTTLDDDYAIEDQLDYFRAVDIIGRYFNYIKQKCTFHAEQQIRKRLKNDRTNQQCPTLTIYRH